MTLDILVCVKRTANVSQLIPSPETGEPQLDLVPYQLSDFDENAVEAAMQLKEEHGGSVTLVTASATSPSDVLPKALAMGANTAISIVDDVIDGLDPFGISTVLAECIRRYVPRLDLIFCGEGSVDDYSCQVGPRLAEHLSIPCITYVTRLEISDRRIRAERTLERKTELVSAPTPALITVGGEINKPRHVSLLRIMAASRRAVKEVRLSDLNLDGESLKGLRTLKVSAPMNSRRRSTLEGSPDEVSARLVAQLTTDGVIGD